MQITKEELLASAIITITSPKFTRVIKKVGPAYFQMVGGKSVDVDTALESINFWLTMPSVTIKRA
jgi:hypothetical protein